MVYVFLSASVLAFAVCLVLTGTVRYAKEMFQTINATKSAILDDAVGDDVKEAVSRAAAVALLKGFGRLILSLSLASAAAAACVTLPVITGLYGSAALAAAAGNGIFIGASSAFMLLVLFARR